MSKGTGTEVSLRKKAPGVKFDGLEVLETIIVALTFGGSAVAYPSMPENMVVHWTLRPDLTLHGDVLLGKLWALSVIPIMSLMVFVTLRGVFRRTELYERVPMVYHGVTILMVSMLLVFQLGLIWAN